MGVSPKGRSPPTRSDELKSYRGTDDENTRNETVDHLVEEWVVSDAHTISLENVVGPL